MSPSTSIELPRETDAADFEDFVKGLGLHARRGGTTVEILDAKCVVGATVTAWLAERHKPLVPSALGDGDLALRPPAA